MMRLNEVKVKRDKIEGRKIFFHFHSWKWGMGEKNGGRANLIKQRRYDLVPGYTKGVQKNMYTLCTPGCTSLYPLSFNTKYVHPLYAQKGRECMFGGNFKKYSGGK